MCSSGSLPPPSPSSRRRSSKIRRPPRVSDFYLSCSAAPSASSTSWSRRRTPADIFGSFPAGFIPSTLHLPIGITLRSLLSFSSPSRFGWGSAIESLRWAYIVLAALQIGAVVASGSRAGTALVIAELVVVIVLAYLRNRQKAFLYSAALALLLSLLFISAAGTGLVAKKLQEHDQLAVRREINKSSLEMIRERPFTGWGLDTYVPVYPMFAHYDDGTFVNRAHNDWLQWTAEGGIFFSGLMLIIFLWSIVPALRSGWGIGVIAICLHAAVDYPFARFGVCGWYFALVAMLAVCRERPSTKRLTYRRSAA